MFCWSSYPKKIEIGSNRCSWCHTWRPPLSFARAGDGSQINNSNENKPKEYPNSDDRIDLLLSSGGVGVPTIQATRSWVWDWETSVENGWENPPKNLSEATAPFLKQQPIVPGDWETNGWENPPTEPAPKNPRRQIWQLAPRPSLWLKTPKLTLLGKDHENPPTSPRSISEIKY